MQGNLAKQIEDEDPTAILQKFLSLRAVINGSYFAEGEPNSEQSAKFNEIGNGSIGRIYEHPGTPWCYKLSHLPKSDRLLRNYTQQARVRAAFTSFKHCFPEYATEEVEVPETKWFIAAEKDTTNWWSKNMDRFLFESPDFMEKTDLFCMERILPVLRHISRALIIRFCYLARQDAARANPKNEACLIRVLLGRTESGSSTLPFTWWDYPMTADDLQDSGIPTGALQFAEAMGHAMAVMHWEAQLDGKGIKFLLGSSPAEAQSLRHELPDGMVAKLPKQTNTYDMVVSSNFRKKRRMCLWMIDFDACEPITADVNGVTKAVDAFFNTDAYCPRWHPSNTYQQVLWARFRDNYMKCSLAILPTELAYLPEMFLDSVFERVKTNEDQMP